MTEPEATDRLRTLPSSAFAAGATPDQLEPGATFGAYRILRTLGQGGMGIVYEATDTTLERRVAIKLMRRELAEQADFATRFLREARAAAHVMHPNVVVIHQAGTCQGVLFMAFEYVSGGDLASRLARGPLPVADAVRLIIECATGLEAIRHAGLIHRDIKPQNIFLDDQGHAKLGDLGLARSATGEDRVTMTGTALGTPSFMSPEQIEGVIDLDIRSDIHALGATLFNALTGQPPFAGATPFSISHKVMADDRPLLRSLNPALPERLQAVVLRAMARDRAHRFQSPQELIDALRGRGGASVPPPAMPRSAGAHAPATAVATAATATMLTAAARAPGAGAPSAGSRWLVGGICTVLVAIGAAIIWSIIHTPTSTPVIPAEATSAATASQGAAAPAAAAVPPEASVAVAPATSTNASTTPAMIAPAPPVPTTDVAVAPATPASQTPPAASAAPSTTAPSPMIRLQQILGSDRLVAERTLAIVAELAQKYRRVMNRGNLTPQDRRQELIRERQTATAEAAAYLSAAQLEALKPILLRPGIFLHANDPPPP